MKHHQTQTIKHHWKDHEEDRRSLERFIKNFNMVATVAKKTIEKYEYQRNIEEATNKAKLI